MTDWLIVWCLTPFSTVFQLKCTFPCFPRLHLTSTLHNFFRSLSVCFPTSLCSKQWTAVRKEWILSQWLSSILGKKILVEPRIEPAISRSQVLCATDWAMKEMSSLIIIIIIIIIIIKKSNVWETSPDEQGKGLTISNELLWGWTPSRDKRLVYHCANRTILQL